MEKRLTFAIDVDEVLRSLLKNMVSLYNESFGENLDANDIKDYVVENSFPKIQEVTGVSPSRWFFQDHGEELFRMSEAFPGIKDDLDRLRKYGDVIIVTYQKTFNNKVDTLEWLDEHGLSYDGICFLKDKTLLHADYMLDDNDWNFVGCNARCGILITAPYNESVDVDELWFKSHCTEMHRFDSLHQFVDWFESEIEWSREYLESYYV